MLSEQPTLESIAQELCELCSNQVLSTLDIASQLEAKYNITNTEKLIQIIKPYKLSSKSLELTAREVLTVIPKTEVSGIEENSQWLGGLTIGGRTFHPNNLSGMGSVPTKPLAPAPSFSQGWGGATTQPAFLAQTDPELFSVGQVINSSCYPGYVFMNNTKFLPCAGQVVLSSNYPKLQLKNTLTPFLRETNCVNPIIPGDTEIELPTVQSTNYSSFNDTYYIKVE